MLVPHSSLHCHGEKLPLFSDGGATTSGPSRRSISAPMSRHRCRARSERGATALNRTGCRVPRHDDICSFLSRSAPRAMKGSLRAVERLRSMLQERIFQKAHSGSHRDQSVFLRCWHKADSSCHLSFQALYILHAPFAGAEFISKKKYFLILYY